MHYNERIANRFERSEKEGKLTGLELLVATFQNLAVPYQVLIIPLTLWSGMEQGFFHSDVTAVSTNSSCFLLPLTFCTAILFQAYISCAYGVENVGFVLITYGVCDAVFSMAFGSVISYVGRVPIFLLGAAINYALILLFFLWEPNPEQSYVLYVASGLWGVADAVWQTQINGRYIISNPCS